MIHKLMFSGKCARDATFHSTNMEYFAIYQFCWFASWIVYYASFKVPRTFVQFKISL